jgi:F-type H+-transporting ATPase subunit b
MLTPDYSFIVQMVSFLVFCFLFKTLLFDPVGRILGERHSRTEGRKKEAEALLAEARHIEQEIARRLETARMEAAAKREDVRRIALAEEEEILRLAREETEKMLTEARRSVQAEVDRARPLLQQEARDLSNEIVARVLG